MGIQAEFNPDLALRDTSQYFSGSRREAECLPGKIEAGKVYPFLKIGQRLYWLNGQIPLLKTAGNENLSRPVASIIIKWATHFLHEGVVHTRGEYEVIEVFNDKEVHFEGYARVNAAPQTITLNP